MVKATAGSGKGKDRTTIPTAGQAPCRVVRFCCRQLPIANSQLPFRRQLPFCSLFSRIRTYWRENPKMRTPRKDLLSIEYITHVTFALTTCSMNLQLRINLHFQPTKFLKIFSRITNAKCVNPCTHKTDPLAVSHVVAVTLNLEPRTCLL